MLGRLLVGQCLPLAALVLVLEYSIRVFCYLKLATLSATDFFATKSNASDLIVSFVDVAYLYAALTSKRSFWAEIIVDYAPLVRMLRLAGLATSILRMLMLSGVVRGVFGCLKFLYSPTKEDGMDDEEKIQTNARSDKAIVDDYSTFRRYISAISLNELPPNLNILFSQKINSSLRKAFNPTIVSSTLKLPAPEPDVKSSSS